MARAPIQPMLARAVDQLPTSGDHVFEPKLDGYRCMIVVDRHGEVQLLSRRGARFVAFPEITEASARILPPDTVVDGELVIWRDQRTDFAALHTRVTAGPRHATELSRRLPAHGALFDALIVEGRDIRSRPLAYRRLVLEQLMADAPRAFPLICWLQTSDLEIALTWMDELAPAGIEGLIAKPTSSPYSGGARGWLKYKPRHTIETIIGAITGTLSAPDRLILGRYDSGHNLRVVATTGALPAAIRAGLAGRLTAADHHPWPDQIITAWRGPPTPILRVVPDSVIEVSVDKTLDQGRYRHVARAVRLRPDLTPEEIEAFGRPN